MRTVLLVVLGVLMSTFALNASHNQRSQNNTERPSLPGQALEISLPCDAATAVKLPFFN